MPFHYTLHDREPKAKALFHLTAALQLNERVEYTVTIFGRYPRTVIFHGQPIDQVASVERHSNIALGESHRIIEQVFIGRLQQVDITNHLTRITSNVRDHMAIMS